MYTVCTVHKCYTTLKNSKHFVINSNLLSKKRLRIFVTKLEQNLGHFATNGCIVNFYVTEKHCQKNIG